MKEKEGLKGVKLRKSSSAQDAGVSIDTRKGKSTITTSADATERPVTTETKEDTTHNAEVVDSPPTTTSLASKPLPATVKASSTIQEPLRSLGLAGYSSSEDD